MEPDCCPARQRYSPLFEATRRLPSRRAGISLVLSFGVLVFVLVTVRRRGCSCECSGGPACEMWSCERPLAHGLHDQWPQWPPVASDAIPRDNLPLAAAERWRALHRSQAEAAGRATGANQVAFLGDSITEGWIRSGFSGRAPSVAQPLCEAIWTESFGAWSPLNFGIGGDRAQDLGWRLQHGLLASALRPKVFVVMIGTNDLGAGERWDVAASEVQLVLEQLHLTRPEARVLLHAVLPRGGDEGARQTARFHRSPWWSASTNNHYEPITRVNERLAAFATRRATWLTFVDCSHLFLSRAAEPADQLAGGEAREEATLRPTGRRTYIPLHLMYDLLHLTPEAYRLWGSCLRPKIAEAVGKG